MGSIHEELKVPGRIARLSKGLLWHYSYRDLSDYFVRFNRYTSAIAERHMAEGKRVPILGSSSQALDRILHALCAASWFP